MVHQVHCRCLLQYYFKVASLSIFTFNDEIVMCNGKYVAHTDKPNSADPLSYVKLFSLLSSLFWFSDSRAPIIMFPAIADWCFFLVKNKNKSAVYYLSSTQQKTDTVSN